MKRILSFVGLAAFLFAACKKETEFNISGKATNVGNIKKVYLYKTDKLIDSALLSDRGEFKFKRTAPDPDFYTLAFGEKSFMVIAQNGDDITFETNIADSANIYQIGGSEASEKVREFNQISNKYGQGYVKLQHDYEAALAIHPNSKDSIYNSLMPQLLKNMDAYAVEALEFSEKNKGNLAGFYAIGTINNPDKYEAEMIKFAEDIKPLFPKNTAVQSFVAKMENIKPISIGKQAPVFTLPTPDGKQISLSDYKGKYVLLDFWASWCVPCREENPNVVKQYMAFKNKGFDILSVSLDENKTAWLKAIKDDGLTWSHVSELSKDTWNGKVTKMYKIDAIPSSFLLGPKGEILAKNLRGIELADFLKRTLN